MAQRFLSDINLGDNIYLRFGNREESGSIVGDFYIRHSGANTWLTNSTGTIILKNNADDKGIAFMADNGNGSATTYFELEADQSTYDTGSSSITALYTTWKDNSRIALGTDRDLLLYHDSTNSHIINTTGDLTIHSQGDDLILKAADDALLYVDGTDIAIQAIGNGKVGLRYNNVQKLETTSAGINVTGTVTLDNVASIQGVDTGNPQANTDELRVSGYGIMGRRGTVYVTNSDPNGSVQIGVSGSHNSNPKLVINASNSLFYTNVRPNADSTYDLGSSSYYWANAYIDAITTTGDVTVGGDLIVNGTTTTLNTQTVEVEDNIIQLNTTQGSPDTATATTSGITIYRGDGVTQASFIFDDSDDYWDLTHNLKVAGSTYLDGFVTIDHNLDITSSGVIRMGGTEVISAARAINATSGTFLAKGTQLGTSGYYINSTFKDTGDNVGVFLAHNDTANGTGAIAGINQLAFLTYGSAWTQALLLDSNQNASFAGDIELDENLTFTTNNYVDIANTGTGAMRFKPSGSTLALTLAGANATFEGNIITSGNILLNENRIIARNTSDGSDSGYIAVVGGGAESDGRGAIIRYYGNEHSSEAGRLKLSSGNITGSFIDFRAAGSDVAKITSTGLGIGRAAVAKLTIEGDGSVNSNIFFQQSGSQEHRIYAATNNQYNTIGSSSPKWYWGQHQSSGSPTIKMSLVGDALTAGSFVKSGGTSSQYLMADGSVSTSATDSTKLPLTGGTLSGDLDFSTGHGRDKIDLNGSDAHTFGTESYHNTYGPNTWNSGIIGHKFYGNANTVIATIGTGGNPGSKDSEFYGNNISINSGGGTPSLKIIRNLGSGISPGVSLGFINIENSASTGSDNRAVIFEGFTDGGSANATGGGLRIYTKNASTGSNTVAITAGNTNNVTLHGSTYTNTIYSNTNSAYYIDVAAGGTGLNMAGSATFGGDVTISKDGAQLRLKRADGADDDWRFYSWGSGLNIYPQTASTIFFGRDGQTADVNVWNGDFTVASGNSDFAGTITTTSTATGAITLNGGTGVATTGAFVLRQNGDGAGNGIAITSSNASSHRIWKDASGNLNIGPSSDADAFKQDLSGNASFAGDVTVEGGHQKILVGAYSNYAQTTDRLYIGGDGLASADAAIYIGNRGNDTGYGYRIYYEGTGTGNNNKLILKSENNGTNVDMLSFTADGNATFAQDLTISGDLIVTGNTTSVNVEDLNVEQGEITLNYAASSDTSSSADGSGIRIQDAVNATTDATMLWNATDDRFVFSNTIQAPGLRSTTSNAFTGGMSYFQTTLTNNDDWQNSPVSILERGAVSSNQTANKYSPNLNFHWGGIVSRSLWMDSSGNLNYGEYDSSGNPGYSNGFIRAHEMHAGVFKDKDSTGYYLDPANTGTSLNVAGGGTFAGGIAANGGISGLTLANGGISGSNYNISGVNQLSIADPGEGIVFGGGSSGNIVLAVTDDSSDNILAVTGGVSEFSVAGNVKHNGLTMTDGTDVDQVKEFSMTFQLSANTWTDTGIDGTDLATGTYAMQVYVGDYAVGGGHYDEYYSATISWFSTNTNDTGVDEIIVHRAGHAPTSGDVQFRTQRTVNADSHDLMLQVKHNLSYTAALDGTTTGKKMIFKFRRLI